MINQTYERNLMMNNCTARECVNNFISKSLGEPHINWQTLIPLTIIYSLFLIIGVLGNLATCMVIISNQYMRTSTNFYLLNLALTDVSTLTLSIIIYKLFRRLHYSARHAK